MYSVDGIENFIAVTWNVINLANVFNYCLPVTSPIVLTSDEKCLLSVFFKMFEVDKHVEDATLPLDSLLP